VPAFINEYGMNNSLLQLYYRRNITMKSKAIFYHAGCPVCVEAEQNVALALDESRFDLEVVHLGDDRQRIDEAKNMGVKSVPALLLGDKVFHINYGASLADLN